MAMHFFVNALSTASIADRNDETTADAQRLLTALLTELDFAFVGTAISASLATARAMLRPVAPHYSVISFLPAEPRLWSGATLSVAGLGFPPGTEHALRALRETLFDASVATRAIHVAEESRLNVPGSNWMGLSTAWRQTAAAAVRAGDGIHAFVSEENIGGANSNWPELRELLFAARNGGTPCLTTAGTILFPNWADRRQNDRKVLDMPAWICTGESKRRIVVADISQTGFGLAACGRIAPGDSIAVETASGRILSGIAIWAHSDRAGVRFREPLQRTDVLLNY